jgi:hypothetical protein
MVDHSEFAASLQLGAIDRLGMCDLRETKVRGVEFNLERYLFDCLIAKNLLIARQVEVERITMPEAD